MRSKKEEAKEMSEVYRLKGVLQSDDGGKTWWPYRIDYISKADNVHSKFSFVADDVKKAFETLELERVVKES